MTAFAAVLVLSMVTAALPASASHFRASSGEVDVVDDALTWTVESAWAHGTASAFFGAEQSVALRAVAASDPSAGGTSLACSGLSGQPAFDTTSPLFDHTTEVVTVDLTCLETADAGSPYVGMVEIYGSGCCRVGGVQNTSGNDTFSQRTRFTRNADGTIDGGPEFQAPRLYELIVPGQALEVDYTALDPEAGAVTYEVITSASAPDYGAAALPCSTFTDGVLHLGADLCASGVVFADQFPEGAFFAVKVRALDAAGNSAETDTLLRVPGPPAAYFADIVPGGSSVTFSLALEDTDTATPSSWTVECTSQSDPAVVRSQTVVVDAPSADVTVADLTETTTYDCVASAVNAVGEGPASAPEAVTTLTTQTITFAPLADVPPGADPVPVTATASSGLDVTFTAGPPEVCAYDGDTGTVVIVGRGTCTVTASQAGDATYGPVELARSFSVGIPPRAGVVGRDAYLVNDDGTITIIEQPEVPARSPIIGVAPTPSGAGTWALTPDGGVFTHGDAGFYGSAAGLPLAGPAVGIVARPSGEGYRIVAADGGVFAFGDAQFHGSAAGLPLNHPVTGIDETCTGDGYYLVADDGGVFAYGDAQFHGSMGGTPLNREMIGIVPFCDGDGYWLFARDGGVFAFGDATFHGSLGSQPPASGVVAMIPYEGGREGYWLLDGDGVLHAYGAAVGGRPG